MGRDPREASLKRGAARIAPAGALASVALALVLIPASGAWAQAVKPPPTGANPPATVAAGQARTDPVPGTQARANDTPEVLAARQRLAKVGAGPEGDTANAAINARYQLGVTLENDGRFAEAEAEYQILVTLLTPRLAPNDRNMIALGQRMANVQVGQEHFEAALATARPAYDQALAELGTDHEVTQDLRLALAASLARLGRYGEREPFARAAFDRMRAQGDEQGAADIAATLALIYERLERPNEARAVLRLVEGDDPLRRLINTAERAEDPALEAEAWRRVLEVLPADSADRFDTELKLAFALAMSATDANPAPAREAATLTRDLIQRAGQAGRTDIVDQAEQVLSTALIHLTAEEGDAEQTSLAVAQRGLTEALARGDADSRAVVMARLYLAMTAASQRRFDLASPELDRLEAWIAAHPGGLDAQSQGYVAITRAFVQGEQDDLAGAYGALSQASRATQAAALGRTDGSGREQLNHWSDLFRTQVRWAWRYAGELAEAPAGSAAIRP